MYQLLLGVIAKSESECKSKSRIVKVFIVVTGGGLFNERRSVLRGVNSDQK